MTPTKEQIDDAVDYFNGTGSGLKKQGRDLHFIRVLIAAASRPMPDVVTVDEIFNRVNGYCNDHNPGEFHLNREGLELVGKLFPNGVKIVEGE